MIHVTDRALDQMRKILESNKEDVVRYELKGGGCGGYISHWSTEKKYLPEEGDLTWELSMFRLFVIDRQTGDFLDGSTIDYGEDPFMPVFKVSSPDKDACGCGSSFKVD